MQMQNKELHNGNNGADSKFTRPTRSHQTQIRSHRRLTTAVEFSVRNGKTCNWTSVFTFAPVQRPVSLASSPTMSSKLVVTEARLSNPLELNPNLALEEQTRKALESAFGGKKPDFEKWSQEIKRREEAGGGWFGWDCSFGGSDGDHRFWQEAQQASLTILGLLAVYLVVTKGDTMAVVLFNPLLFALRWIRTAFTLVTSKTVNRNWENISRPQEEVAVHVSAKDRVVGKLEGN